MTLTLPLATDRTLLRLHRRDDAAALLRYYSRPEVARYLLDEPWDEKLAEERIVQHMGKTGLEGRNRSLAVVVEHEGEVIGDVTVWLNDGTGKKAEIGWVFSPDAGGQGLATEAIGALVRALFAEHGLHRLEAQMDARNAPSARLAERLGMDREAHLRQNWWSKGQWTDTLVFGLLAGEE